MWQISAPPPPPPPATIANLGYYIFVNLHDFGQKGGLPIKLKWTNLEIFQQFSVQNLTLTKMAIWHSFYAGTLVSPLVPDEDEDSTLYSGMLKTEHPKLE